MTRPKAQDLPNMDGPGVGVEKFKDLDRLGDKFIEIRDEKAALATKLRDTERKLAELMADKGITRYRFGDQEIVIKIGATHIKIKTIKVDGAANGEEDLENEND